MAEAEGLLLEYCGDRVSPEVRDQIRLEVEKNVDSLTIVERRPPWQPDDPDPSWSKLLVARFRYDPLHANWALEWPDSDLDWHPYTGIVPSPDIMDLLEEVDTDPTGIFYG